MVDRLILCYHKVGPANIHGRRLNIEVDQLEKHVKFFSKRLPPVRVGDLTEDTADEFLAFTFDDAYKSTLELAPDILRRHGAHGTFFPVTELVGSNSIWDGEQAAPLADWDLIDAVHKQGHEIGNHTADHKRLAELWRTDQKDQISRAHETLREHGIQSKSLCFPYGSYDGDTLTVMSELGYNIGLALRKQATGVGEDLRNLSRVPVAYSDSLAMLFYRVNIRPRLRRK